MKRKEEIFIPRSDREAIEFALYHLDPEDIPSFLAAWLHGELIDAYFSSPKHKNIH
mgnify:FL=1|jgi:hypothetical protein